MHFIPEYLNFQKPTEDFQNVQQYRSYILAIVHSGCKITTYSEQGNVAVN